MNFSEDMHHDLVLITDIDVVQPWASINVPIAFHSNETNIKETK
jgi:hypothetical protein